ncbi:MAG: METTL5 family protein [Thermoplasmataceae archaeon]
MSLRSSKELELKLEKLHKPLGYKDYFEQYPTDSGTASKILTMAYLRGDVKDRIVADLGAGTGTFAYGAALMGARIVYAVEKDRDLLPVLQKNLNGLPARIIVGEVSSFSEAVDTVFMNAPFGSVKPHADIPFLNAALAVANVVYSIHNIRSRNFIMEYYGRHGEIFLTEQIQLAIPHLFPHHEKKVYYIPSILVGVRVKRHRDYGIRLA